jgi:hypothetical protein
MIIHKRIIFFIITILTLFIFIASLSGAPPKKEAADKKDSKKKAEDKLEDVLSKMKADKGLKSSFAGTWKPSAGAMFNPILPLGELSSNGMSLGFGGRAFFSLGLPYNPLKKLKLTPRIGLSVGFTNLGSDSPDFTSSINFIPILLYTEISYPLKKYKLRPFFTLGGGGSAGSMEKKFSEKVTGGAKSGNAQEKVDTFDGTLVTGLGLGYSVKKNIEIIFDVQYLRFFELKSGNFIQISLGAAYNFTSILAL